MLESYDFCGWEEHTFVGAGFQGFVVSVDNPFGISMEFPLPLELHSLLCLHGDTMGT